MVFLVSKSIEALSIALNRSPPLSGINSTLFLSPRVATATALHKSTSKPDQFPASSAFEKPSRPVLTPHLSLPLF